MTRDKYKQKDRVRNMEFHNRLYNLRKQKGLSQEELANRLNVSRQTISKWEIGDSTPDMEKLAAISELFEVSLDELVLGKEQDSVENGASNVSEIRNVLEEKILTPENKKKVGKGLKIAGILLGVIVVLDFISMIIYFALYGAPK